MDASYSTVQLTRGEKTIRISLDDLEVRTFYVQYNIILRCAGGRARGNTFIFQYIMQLTVLLCENTMLLFKRSQYIVSTYSSILSSIIHNNIQCHVVT